MSLLTRVADLGATPSVAGVQCLQVTGPDAATFLQGQLTQDLAALPLGEVTSALLLEPDGHLGWLVQVVRAAEEQFLVLGPSGPAASEESSEILSRLQRFKIRVSADLESVSAARSITPGPLALGERWPGVQEFLELGSEVTGPDLIDLRCLHAGVITPSVRLEGLTPLGLGSEAMNRMVSFTKGCYTGQELVARMDARVAAPPLRLARLSAGGAGFSEDLDLEGVEGARVIGAVFDESTQTLGGLVEVPRRAELGDGLVVVVGGLQGTLSELR